MAAKERADITTLKGRGSQAKGQRTLVVVRQEGQEVQTDKDKKVRQVRLIDRPITSQRNSET